MTPVRSAEPVPIAMSWSGGKDSSLALHALREDSRYEVIALLTSVSREYDRISIHGVRRTLLEAQAEAIGLPLFEVALGTAVTNAAYERAFQDAAAALKKAFTGLRHIAFGDLFLSDVRAYRERLVSQCGMEPVFPLWGLDTTALAQRFVAEGYRAHLVCVDTEQLDREFAGRAFDGALLADLPSNVDPCGENGEFHTFVSAGPIFSAPIGVRLGARVVRDERFAYCDVIPL